MQGVLEFLRSRILARVGAALDESFGTRIYDAIVRLPLLARGSGDGMQPLRDLDTVRSFMASAGPTALFDLPWMPLYLVIAFLFESMMLLTGAIWAQDAWGRYWAWDPLETWAFLTWLALAFGLHLKIWLRPPAVVWSGMVTAVFVLAFVTFFGVPFVSDVPHKGVF
jgi:hypothetical protein